MNLVVFRKHLPCPSTGPGRPCFYRRAGKQCLVHWVGGSFQEFGVCLPTSCVYASSITWAPHLQEHLIPSEPVDPGSMSACACWHQSSPATRARPGALGKQACGWAGLSVLVRHAQIQRSKNPLASWHIYGQVRC